MADNSLYYIQQGSARLDRLQEKIASGMNINRPSDDPAAARYLYDINDKLKAGEQYLGNITKATTWENLTDTALAGMEDTMLLAKKLANTMTSGSTDASERQNVITQLQTLKQQMIDMGNTQIGNQYLFGGAQNSTPPFTNVVSPPALPTDYYTGDETVMQVETGNNSTHPMNIPGNRLLTADTAASQPYGTTNILKAFDDLVAAVNANNVTNIQSAAQALDDGAAQITNARSDVASRMIRLESSAEIIEKNNNTLENFLGNLQNADYTKLAVELNQQKTAYEASLATSAKLSQLSLLNYL